VQSFFGAIWWTDGNVAWVMLLLIGVALVVGAIGSTLSVSWYLKT
jgi:cell division transport system permease protein